jgi:hypothetical protein
LSSASPESFGFLGNESGAINIDGATLKFKSGTDAVLVGNDIGIGIDNATISNSAAITTGMAEAGVDLQLIATGATPTDVKLDTLPSQATGGDLTINNSSIDVSGNGSASIAIRAGDVVATDSYLFADNGGDDSMSTDDGIDVHARSLTAVNTTLSNDVLATGNGGRVNVTVDQTLTLLNGGSIHGITFAQGDAGTVTVNAGQVEIDGKGYQGFTGIASRAESGSRGNAGSVMVTVDGELSIANGGSIDTSFMQGILKFEIDLARIFKRYFQRLRRQPYIAVQPVSHGPVSKRFQLPQQLGQLGGYIDIELAFAIRGNGYCLTAAALRKIQIVQLQFVLQPANRQIHRIDSLASAA